ncbi:unnamed protein product [Orchesella dallaii]|uniref:Uncharacterized protein n=1 Tax=Orchesella dallaii TaxID=48710 RepID=A0ABP1Q406_9HEXA
MSLLPTIFHVVFSYIVIIVGLMSFATVDAAPIVLFEDSHFKGINSTFQIGESTCVNLVGKLSDFYSSVDSMGLCFLLCEHTNCRGKCEKVGGKLRDLSTIGLNDLVSSISLCDSEDDVGHHDQDTDHPAGQLNSQPSRSNSTRVFRRRSISTTATPSSTNRKTYKATRRSTARTTTKRRSRSRTLAQKTLPTSSSSLPSTAQPIVFYLNHDVAWRTTTESESTTMSSSALPSTAQKQNSNANNNSQNMSKTTNHLPVGVVHITSRSDDDDGGSGGRRRYRSNRVSSYNTHTSKEFDIAKSYPRRRIPSNLSNHRRRRKIFQRQDQQQPIIIQKEEST